MPTDDLRTLPDFWLNSLRNQYGMPETMPPALRAEIRRRNAERLAVSLSAFEILFGRGIGGRR